ncbi:Crp/Fnr family transcriptional regulator [Mucilaginibacter flavus]|nr:Crp/Fnr family transcriptional regulator [Mucilaginibacter flavus]
MNGSIDNALLAIKEFAPKTTLVTEGDVATEMMFINSGCIRAWYNADGQEITLQFFFEGDSVTSLESFLNNPPSNINIETLEHCQLSILKKADFLHLLQTDAVIKNWFYTTAIQKLFTHTNRLLSLLKNKPFDRYQQLLASRPDMFQRIPQHYIASYLGITPVSLSRIRNRRNVVS